MHKLSNKGCVMTWYCLWWTFSPLSPISSFLHLQCLNLTQLLNYYGLSPDSHISPSQFTYLCPALLYQIDSRVCIHHYHQVDVGQAALEPANSGKALWFHSVTVMQLCSPHKDLTSSTNNVPIVTFMSIMWQLRYSCPKAYTMLLDCSVDVWLSICFEWCHSHMGGSIRAYLHNRCVSHTLLYTLSFCCTQTKWALQTTVFFFSKYNPAS